MFTESRVSKDFAFDQKLLRSRVRWQPSLEQFCDSSGIVYLSKSTGQPIYKIDGFAAFIWSRLPGHRIDSVVVKIATEFQLERARIESDIAAFVLELVRLEFVVLDGEAESGEKQEDWNA